MIKLGCSDAACRFSGVACSWVIAEAQQSKKVPRIGYLSNSNPATESARAEAIPEFRRLGYATTILRLSVQIAREKLGIDRILVTCDDDNIGSIRTIEKNGGILDNMVSGSDLDKPKRRYWIEGSRALAAQSLS